MYKYIIQCLSKLTTLPSPARFLHAFLLLALRLLRKIDKFGIKIRGAFATRDEAANHAKRLQKEDPTFDIYVVDMYKWLLIPPDPTKIEDVHYSNEKLEEIMTGYKENQALAARMFQERKEAMMNAKAFVPGDENSMFYTKADEAPISHPPRF